VTDDEWLTLLHGDQPDRIGELRRARAVLMDRVTAIDDLIAELEAPPPTIPISTVKYTHGPWPNFTL
jgi:hypothetical protein